MIYFENKIFMNKIINLKLSIKLSAMSMKFYLQNKIINFLDFKSFRQSKRILFFLIFIIFRLFLNNTFASIKKPIELTIIHFSDLHSAFEPIIDKKGNSLGGIARIKGYINQLEKEGKNLLILCSGDIIQGTINYKILGKLPEIEILNFLNVSAMALGNHEFDGGLELLQNGYSKANFDLLSANIVFPNYFKLKESIKKYIIKELIINNETIKIAIIGLTDDMMKEEVPISKLQGIIINDAILTLRKLLPEILEQKPDIVILLSHLGWKKEQEISILFPEIHGILGGHTHLFIDPPIVKETKYGHQFLGEPGDYGKSLSRYDLIIHKASNEPNANFSKVIVKNAKLVYMDCSIPECLEAKELVKKLKDDWSQKTSIVIGKTNVFLDGERVNVRNKDTNLGNIIADAILEAYPSDASFINGGGIRRSFSPGNITLSDCYTCLPFENNLVRLYLYGSDIIKTFEEMLDGLQLSPSYGGFLHVSGNMKVSCNEDGQFEIRINNNIINPNKIYTITTVDYLADGGNGLNSLTKAKKRETSNIIAAEALIDYFKKRKVIDHQTQIRISIPCKFYYKNYLSIDSLLEYKKLLDVSLHSFISNKFIINILKFLVKFMLGNINI